MATAIPFNLGTLGFSSGMFGSFMVVTMWSLIAIAIILPIVIAIRNKLKYTYSGEVYKIRQENFTTGLPQAQIISGKAGYFMKKGKTIFRIKYGKMPWKKIETTKLPDPKYMIGNKAYFLQLNKDNLTQAKLSIDWTGKMKLEAVEDDIKYGAFIDIIEKTNILNTSRLTPQIVGMLVMGFILVAGIIVYYFLSKA